MIELRHLSYFLAVAEERNFTRAAERVGIQQPPLSRQIRDLEETVGARLLRRDRKGAVLTEAGAASLATVRHIPRQIERAVRKPAEPRGEKSARFALATQARPASTQSSRRRSARFAMTIPTSNSASKKQTLYG